MTKLVTILAIVVPLLAVSTPSFATKGIDAARSCNANPKCTVIFDDGGGATIIIGDVIIDCPGPQEECVVVRRAPKTVKSMVGALPTFAMR